MVRAATAFLRLGPVHERFLRLKFTSPAPLNRTPTSLAPLSLPPRATGRRRRRRHERIRSYGWRRQRRGVARVAAPGHATGRRQRLRRKRRRGTRLLRRRRSRQRRRRPAQELGRVRRGRRSPSSARRGRPTGSPRSPRGTGTRRPLRLRPRIRARTSPVRRRQQTLRGTSQRRRRPRGASSGHHLHRRFPTPRRGPQRRPPGRSTRR